MLLNTPTVKPAYNFALDHQSPRSKYTTAGQPTTATLNINYTKLKDIDIATVGNEIKVRVTTLELQNSVISIS